MELYEKFSGEELKIAEKIQQRRLQMLVHSYIYYGRNEVIVSDHQWAKWANELKDLQEKYPKIAQEVPYGNGFEDWDASTGAFLPYNNLSIVSTAEQLLGIKSTPTTTSKPKENTKNAARKKLF